VQYTASNRQLTEEDSKEVDMVEENKTAVEHDEEHIRKCASLQGRHGKIQEIPM
jgi:hypothetical protein